MVATQDALLAQMRRGTLQYCVLSLLADEERYGFDLVRGLAEMDGMVTSEGTIYPLLSRLRRDGLVESNWQESPSGPAAALLPADRAGARGPRRFQARMAPLSRRRRSLRREDGIEMSTSADRLVEDYSIASSASWRTFPRRAGASSSRRSPSTSPRREPELETESEAEIRNLLDRMGDPADIAAEARGRRGDGPAAAPVERRSERLDVAALILLLVGGVVIPVIGWLVGRRPALDLEQLDDQRKAVRNPRRSRRLGAAGIPSRWSRATRKVAVAPWAGRSRAPAALPRECAPRESWSWSRSSSSRS